MTSEIEAAGRLRKMQNFGDDMEAAEYEVYDSDHNGPFNDMAILADAYLRETDPRLVDEAFAKSVAIETQSITGKLIVSKSPNILLWENARNQWVLQFENRVILWSETIGDFYTACRLFGITVTQTGAEA